MPKSRNRKKHKKAVAARSAKMQIGVNGSSSAKEQSTPARQSFSMRQSLYENDGEMLFQIICCMPLMAGSWLAGGMTMPRPAEFSILLALVIALHYLELAGKDRILYWSKRTIIWSCVSAAIIALGAWVYITASLDASLLAAAFVALTAAGILMPIRGTRQILLNIAALITRMTLLAILGAYSQFPELIWAVGILGFIPGSFLAASLVARHAEIFTLNGWRRERIVTKKSGEELLRPGLLSQLYGFLLILGPLMAIVLVPLNALPQTFFLAVVPIYFMPGLASGFLERLRSDRMTGLKTLNLALVASVLVLAAGILTRFLPGIIEG